MYCRWDISLGNPGDDPSRPPRVIATSSQSWSGPWFYMFRNRTWQHTKERSVSQKQTPNSQPHHRLMEKAQLVKTKNHRIAKKTGILWEAHS